MENVLSGFQKYKTLDKEIIKKYEDSLPKEIIHIWKKYGLGSILNGYLKLINPEEFKEVIDTSYFRKEVSIPVFATGMGDIITWEENKYLRLIEFRKGKFKGISAGFEFFLTDIKSEEFCSSSRVPVTSRILSKRIAHKGIYVPGKWAVSDFAG